MPEIKQPFEVFTDLKGDPLENGYLYIGEPGLEPSSSPISIYFDSGFTIPAPNPLRTIAGYPSRNGSPARVFIKDSDYSLIVRDKKGSLVYSSISGNGSEPGFFSSRTVTIGAGLDVLDLRYSNFDSLTGALLDPQFWINTGQFFKLTIDDAPGGYAITGPYEITLHTKSSGGEVVAASQNGDDAQKKINISAAIAEAFTVDDYVSRTEIHPEVQFGADNTGATDATALIQGIIDLFPDSNIVIRGTYSFSTLDLSDFSGVFSGNGTLKADGTQDIGLNFSDADGVVFNGPYLDMSHTVSTGDEARCRYGFYLRDARNCKITPKVFNVRRGWPYWIDGTASQAGAGQLDSWGSKNIYVIHPDIDAFPDDPDKGAQCIIKSDYYAGDGVTWVSGGNGILLSDYTLDAAAAFPATTSDIYLIGGRYQNCDRIGVLNADHVYEIGSEMIGMNKRGFNVSPTCNNVHLFGGSTRGGISAVINFTLGCSQCSAGGKFIDPEGFDSLSGEATALRVFQGCRDIHFYDIRGKGGALRSIWIVGSSDITWDNVKLDANEQSETENCVEVDAGLGGNTNTWVTSGIRGKNSQFGGKYGLAINMTTGTATYADDGIQIRSHKFNETVSATRAGFLVSPDVTDKFSILDSEFLTATFTTLNPYTHAKGNSRNTYSGNYVEHTYQQIKNVDTDTTPDNWPAGHIFTTINGTASAPDANNQGVLETIKPNSTAGFRKYVVQKYYPANNAGTEYATIYIRRGIIASDTWSAWATITGV